MAAISRSAMSQRGWQNVADIMPKISGAVADRVNKDNPAIDLTTAENWLIRKELIELCKQSLQENIVPKHFSYPTGFAGDDELVEVFVEFFNKYFNPRVTIEPSHLVLTPGAFWGLDALLYNICDPGDGILIPAPYWNAFDFLFKVRSSVKPIAVTTPDLQSTLTSALIPALEAAFDKSTCPIKGIVVTNPHNPLGKCYPRAVLEACVKFCQERDIHFISDEIYALSFFAPREQPDVTPFVSALSLDLPSLGCDQSRVHAIWSTSKDFGQSGVRMGCVVTQDNQALAVGTALATNTQTSSLTAIFVTALLSSPKLPSLITLNSERLVASYHLLSFFLRRHSIPYIPCTAGLYIFARLAKNATTWEEENAVCQRLKDAGILVSAGRAYHVPEEEKGWMRIGFAVPRDRLEEALRRMEIVFSDCSTTNALD